MEEPGHPTSNTLGAFVEGALAADTLAHVETHLADCNECRLIVAGVVHAPAVDIGSHLGRFEVKRLLGRGGMGQVYAAFDPELHRHIAVKLLDHRFATSGTARERLQREAQAIARVSHPNVVVIHDVGTHDDELFIAMAFIEGGTLTAWLKEQARPPDEIVRVFVAAGRGLEAAHRQGLVHRDFKPDNVLMDGDTPKVSDFGLALPPNELPAEPRDERPALALTLTGALVGTPAYMSPEQWLRQPVDARADQFSFAVALYEALWNVRPFGGRTLPELCASVTEGAPRSPPRGPRWVWPLLRRAMARVPSDRYPTIDGLLDALEQRINGRQRRSLWFAGAAAAAGLAVGTAVIVRQQTVCRGFDVQLTSAYSPSVRETIRQALAPSGNADDVVKLLDRFAVRWVSDRETTCRATRVSGEQSESAMDLRVACLDRHRAELGQMATLLSHADAEVARNARRLAGTLGGLDECADVSRLVGVLPEPTEPARRAAIRAAREKLAGYRAVYNAGQYKDGAAQLRALAVETKALDYAPLEAELRFMLALMLRGLADHDGSQKELTAAALAAERGRDDTLRADAWIEVVQSLIQVGRYDEAAQRMPQAEAALARLGSPPPLAAHLLRCRAELLVAKEKFAEARPLIEQAIALLKGRSDRDVALEALLYDDLAALVPAAGEPPEAALPYAEEGLRMWRAVYGERHPYVANSLDGMSATLSMVGRNREAFRLGKEALAMREEQLGPKHLQVGQSLLHVGQLEASAGHFARATAYYDRAEAVLATMPEVAALDLREIRRARASNLVDLERWADAERALQALLDEKRPELALSGHERIWIEASLARVITTKEGAAAGDRIWSEADRQFRASGADDVTDLDSFHLSWVRFLVENERYRDAETLMRSTFTSLMDRMPKSSSRRFEPTLTMGAIELAAGRLAAARPLLEEARRIDDAGDQLSELDRAWLRLAEAELALRQARPRAETTARLDEAQALLAEVEAPASRAKARLAKLRKELHSTP